MKDFESVMRQMGDLFGVGVGAAPKGDPYSVLVDGRRVRVRPVSLKEPSPLRWFCVLPRGCRGASFDWGRGPWWGAISGRPQRLILPLGEQGLIVLGLEVGR